MLKFIFGLPSSGKTTTVLNLIKQKVDLEKQVVLIVPEQFSFQTERSILHILGDNNANKVQVLSFTRLYDEISKTVGGICGKLLCDSDKIILMNRVLSSLENELLVWGKYAHSLNFSKSILDTIGEFKINAITSDDIRKAALISETKNLQNKLLDIALIYENYNAVLGEKYIDPVDKLTKVFRDLEKVEYFKNKTVFFDSFKAFTGQQFKIIDRILNQADDVFVAINNDTQNQLDFDVFHNLRKNISKLENMVKSNKLAEPIILNDTKYTNPKLSALERLMAGNELSDDLNDTITVCKCETLFDEVEFAFRNIRRLVREKGYRFRDFVIIARDTERYQQAVEYVSKKNEISCFYDKKISLNSLPFTFAVDAAIKALDLSSENILRFHKCGFTDLSTDDISLLENYAFLWNLNGNSWAEEWTMDPRGFGIDEMSEAEYKLLSEINSLRQTAIEPIISFKNEFFGSARQMATAIVNLLENSNAKNTLKSLCERFVEINCDISPDVLKQGYERFMTVLDGVVNAFGEKQVNKKEFEEALNLALSVETVGVIPQFLDEVSFGSADRIQPARPKIAFILGANQGVFPQNVKAGGVFANKDRKKIIELGLDISDNSIISSIDENYLVYSNLTCASEKLFITYATKNVKGEELMPSPFVTSICEKLNPTLSVEPNVILTDESLPETEGAAFSELCRRFEDSDASATLIAALADNDKFNTVFSAVNKNLNKITPENAQKLFGNYINLSATKIDTVNRCRFSYFCKYGLRAEKLQAADFNVLQRGNIAHYVLERLIVENKAELTHFSYNELDALTDKYIEEYLNKITGFSYIRDAKFEFLISRISRSLKEVVRHIADDFKQSSFKPVACEFKIGFSDGVMLEFPYDNGKIKINGSIDRVDEWNGYIRIVDYKTGTKSFKLPDILYGLNMQMLIYLYAIIRGQGLDDEKAAAILYMPAKRDVKDEGLAMNGLIKGNNEINIAMEKENKGQFVPSLTFKKDGTISKLSSSYIEENGFSEIFDYIEKLMRKTGNLISDGDIKISPIDGREAAACKYCDFKAICNINETEIIKVPDLSNDEVFEIIKEAEI